MAVLTFIREAAHVHQSLAHKEATARLLMVWSLQGTPLFCYNYAKKDRKRVLLFFFTKGVATQTQIQKRGFSSSQGIKRSKLDKHTYTYVHAHGHPSAPSERWCQRRTSRLSLCCDNLSKHSPGLQINSKHNFKVSSLSLFLHVFLGIPFFPFSPFAATLCQRWQDDGAEENRRRWREENKMAQWREGYDFEHALAGDGAHTHWHAKTQIHTHRVLRVFLFVPGASLLLQSQTSTWLFIAGDTSTGEGQHLRGQKGITGIWQG